MILRHGNVENCRLCRWKTHSQPMEKDAPFPQVCKLVSRSYAGSGSLRTVPQRLLLRISILSFLIRHKKIERKNKKRAGVQPTDEPKSCTPALCLWKVCETEPFFLPIGKDIAARGIIKASSGKADTDNHFAVFPPISPQFLDRLDM